MFVYFPPKQSLYTLVIERRKSSKMSCQVLPLPNYPPSQHIYSLPSKPTRPIPSPLLWWLISPGSPGMQASKHHHQAATLIHSDSPAPQSSPLSSVRSLPAANSSLFSNFEHFLHFPVLIETCGHCVPCCFPSHFHCAKA